MSGIPKASACTCCGEHTHTSSTCHELTSDMNLREGFYTGPGASGGHGDDEDDSLGLTVQLEMPKAPTNLQIDVYSNTEYDGWPW